MLQDLKFKSIYSDKIAEKINFWTHIIFPGYFPKCFEALMDPMPSLNEEEEVRTCEKHNIS